MLIHCHNVNTLSLARTLEELRGLSRRGIERTVFGGVVRTVFGGNVKEESSDEFNNLCV